MSDTKATPTIRDVAELAGTSTASVSRFISGIDVVSPTLGARIQQAIEQLGYVPNAGARALTTQRSGTVGLVIPTIDNAIFAKGIQAFQQRLTSHGLQLLIASSGYAPDPEAEQARNLIARGVDALAFYGGGQRRDLLDLIDQRRLPSVHVGVHRAHPGASCVGYDNVAAMQAAVSHLVSLGHTRLAMLAGITQHNDRAKARVLGFQRCCSKLGAEVIRIDESPYELSAAIPIATQMLSQTGPSFTGLVCGIDVLAWAALSAARHLQRDVPTQLSVVGFDDLDWAQYSHPPLTTLRVPTVTMWQLAADHLHAQLHDDAAHMRSILQQAKALKPELVVRASTGPVA